MRVTVCLLTHNQRRMSLKCIDYLIKNTDLPHRIIWIDNGSGVDTWEAIYSTLNDYYEDLTYIRNEENLFYAEGTNQGLRTSESEFTVCLSNDVYLSPGWLTKMVRVMDRYPDVGVLSPLTDRISGGANVKRYYREHLLPGGSFNAINEMKSGYRDVTGNVALFCGMIRRSVIDKVGYLDEQFFICGNDDDYNDRVRLAGFRTGVVLNVFVGHYHSTTKNMVFPDRAEIKARHRTILKNKRQHRLRTGDYRK